MEEGEKGFEWREGIVETEERQRTWDQGHNHHYYHHKLYTLKYVPAQQCRGAALAPSVLIEHTLADALLALS